MAQLEVFGFRMDAQARTCAVQVRPCGSSKP